ncbi:MAG TPA: SpoIIE family protein phosphatase [Leptospiraceae bacterium]|nr:SpoIIE family protein phosphatase [Leptospiraceae bacterium]HMW06401.1 SpoIIE family protein phosphatase [Leptospiraceae bacterium]HMX31687.1 SpoIIE family protein phosphatase [Leptospiraceae bacterium]HMZ63163.1 SpoIIE family protein phosphatase [Leptospiraceae bacterium]HNA07676.1 SpoIIE family protein phosphatase [Leptospiraceae bacterium]
MFKIFLTFFILPISIYSFPISIKDNWFVKEGFDLNFKNNPSSWQSFKELPVKSTEVKNLSDKKVIVLSFFKEVNISDSDMNQLTESVSIWLPYLSNAYEIYFNGSKIAEEGIFTEDNVVRHGFHRHLITKIPTPLIHSGVNEIYIIVKGVQGEEIAVYGDSNPSIDLHERNIQKNSERISLMLLFLYSFIGFYHMLLFIKRTNEKYNFYFASFCSFLAIYIYTRSNAVYELGIDPMIITRIEYIFLFYITAFSLAFFENFIKGKTGLATKITFGFISILAFPMLFVEIKIAYKLLLVWQIFTLISFIGCIYLMIWGIIKKHQDSKRLFFGFIILVSTGVLDIIGAMGISKNIPNYGLLQYGFFIFVIGIAFVLANRFLRVHSQVEELNLTLEKKVEERTRELQKTLTQVQALKLQQDGDYFLTSLLIKPLMVNEARSNKIKIEFFIKQKKTFEFKNKTYEIGGDMCIANNIKLRGKNYCVFINGDAMGKSIQGAGGALVLGVVFRSIIERTKIFKPNMELFPEQWLKVCFIELQNVFTSFDGSMLVSIVMGLVEENTGALFFLNAEHPWTVLYRDGKASFLEQQLYLHKVGMIGLDGSLRVQIFQMHPGDSILIGSDGRDDIMLGMDPDGQRNINEDGEQFLKHVMTGKGELKGITDSILKVGEFTDDYTLIKISYIEEDKPLEEIDLDYYSLVDNGDLLLAQKSIPQAIEQYQKALKIKKDKDVYYKILDTLYSQKNYKEFIPLCEEYLNWNPIDSDYLFKISYAYKFEGNFSLAIDYGECLKLRDPRNVNNLLNLSDLNRKIGNLARANKLLSDVMYLDPGNLKAQELQRMLEEKTMN